MVGEGALGSDEEDITQPYICSLECVDWRFRSNHMRNIKYLVRHF